MQQLTHKDSNCLIFRISKYAIILVLAAVLAFQSSILLIGHYNASKLPGSPAIESWVKNKSIEDCIVDDYNNWICELKSKKGIISHVVWNQNGPAFFRTPHNWQASRIQNSGGEILIYLGNDQLIINSDPIYIY